MNYSNPSNIGLIACPGGERFTELVAKSLAGIYKRRFERKTKVLAERYGISLADAVRQMNFSNDTQSNLPHVPGDIGHYRGPRLKIHTRYSWFANGEVKAEIQDSRAARTSTSARTWKIDCLAVLMTAASNANCR